MEVLSCSSVQNVGESDCPRQISEADFVYHGETNVLENDKAVMEGSQIERKGEIQKIVDGLSNNSGGYCSGGSYSSNPPQTIKTSGSFHVFDDEDINDQSFSPELRSASENLYQVVDTIESESPNDNEPGELPLSAPTWLAGDESTAVWVKWRGKWQAGIRCPRADWPLSTLRAKPTHDRKQYFVIFFPHTRIYSWADMLLIRPINEFPEPVAYRTHKIGLKMVKDLTVPRRFIMQKLAVSMLNIVDQFHAAAFLETARDVEFWKEFAAEASSCNAYSDLGRLLTKLQNMILPHFVSACGIEHSLMSWIERCQNADSAESIEILKEELFNSILWSNVNSHRDATQQPTLASLSKLWKHEVAKRFSTSHAPSKINEVSQQNSEGSFPVNLQSSRKRPKLEVRRADAHNSQVVANAPDHAISLETDAGFFTNQETVTTLESETLEKESFTLAAVPMDSPSSMANEWNDIVVEAKTSESFPTNNVESTPVNQVSAAKAVEISSKNRQCIAYIESKGRQCVRWANEGDVYCCVHLASRFSNSSARAERAISVDGPMCEGTTVLGTRCKHRALHGSSFCKKHKPHIEVNENLDLSHTNLKRKLEECNTGLEGSSCKGIDVSGEYNTVLEGTNCKDTVVARQAECSLQVVPLSFMDDGTSFGQNIMHEKNPSFSGTHLTGTEVMRCIGSAPYDNSRPCLESPRRHFLYCENHVPSWLKRARNGKSRIVSKDVFTHLLKHCSSQDQRMHLHKACDLFHRLFKSILSLRNPVPKEVQFRWALSEASKDSSLGEFFRKLVHSEKERIREIWGFDDVKDIGVSSTQEGPSLPLSLGSSNNQKYSEHIILCKICSAEFLDDEGLGTHWRENHKKEAQWLFRGYACAICLDSFTNKKFLETHVQERHHVQFVEQCMLMQCILCRSNFGNTEQLWSHVLSIHPIDLRLPPPQQNFATGDNSPIVPGQGNSTSMENNSENPGDLRKYLCKFCGLKFDLLPDLGRHHQAAHMGPNLISSHLSKSKKGVRYFAYRLKSGRLSRPRFKKSLATASYRIRNRTGSSLKRHIKATKPLSTSGLTSQPQAMEMNIRRLAEFDCSSVAKIMFSEIQKTKPRPTNHEILSIARSACCKVSLKALLEDKYGVLPERGYLKAAKLCSEQNIQVNWHLEGVVCPRECRASMDQMVIPPLSLLPNCDFSMRQKYGGLPSPVSDEWEADESHFIINSGHLRPGSVEKGIVLCDDISFGQEIVPVVCVVDEELLDSLDIQGDGSDGKNVKLSLPWESFTYATMPKLKQPFDPDEESFQLRCSCSSSTCCPEACDHVYLFDTDYDDAKDSFGKSMHGRFPYDENGRIILEEGYLVYECNNMCRCSKVCPNRVLQNGLRVKLEVFRTEKKGWAVRAGEAILHGTFVCEYIGEVLEEDEANDRRNRYRHEVCNYLFDVDAHINDMSRLIEGQGKYVIDATNYGNVSRFINHSCSPNLVTHQVLVESMESERAHIGLYANRDVAMGEELTYNYRYHLIPGEGCPCHCESSRCRGRLY